MEERRRWAEREGIGSGLSGEWVSISQSKSIHRLKKYSTSVSSSARVDWWTVEQRQGTMLVDEVREAPITKGSDREEMERRLRGRMKGLSGERIQSVVNEVARLEWVGYERNLDEAPYFQFVFYCRFSDVRAVASLQDVSNPRTPQTTPQLTRRLAPAGTTHTPSMYGRNVGWTSHGEHYSCHYGA